MPLGSIDWSTKYPPRLFLYFLGGVSFQNNHFLRWAAFLILLQRISTKQRSFSTEFMAFCRQNGCFTAPRTSRRAHNCYRCLLVDTQGCLPPWLVTSCDMFGVLFFPLGRVFSETTSLPPRGALTATIRCCPIRYNKKNVHDAVFGLI